MMNGECATQGLDITIRAEAKYSINFKDSGHLLSRISKHIHIC